MDTKHKVIGIIALILGAWSFLFGGVGGLLGAGNGSTSHTLSQYDAAGGFSVNGTVIADTSGRLTGVVSTTALTLSGGTSMSNYTCGTKTFLIPAISGVNSATGGGAANSQTSVTVTGIVPGDEAIVSWNPASATSSLNQLNMIASADASSGLAIVSFVNTGASTSTAINASGTIKVCFIH